MKKYLYTIAIFIVTMSSYAQITYEKGYFITNSNEKINCLIKNQDWRNNPTNFIYKLSDTEKEKNITTNLVKELNIYGNSKYIRTTINIDRSSSNLNNLSKERRPIFQKEKLFLKVLVEGDANLYLYVNGNLRRYFFSTSKKEITQLIFKKYRATSSINVIQNERYKQQLWSSLKCKHISFKNAKNLEYKNKALVNYFLKYNSCQNPNNLVNFEKTLQKRNGFNLTVKAGINTSSFKVHSPNSYLKTIDFGTKKGVSFGIEGEYVLPFNNNKWALITEATYRSFKSKNEVQAQNVSGGEFIINAKYSSIEVPVGIRHYIFINPKSKIFINASYIIDMPINSSVNFIRKTNNNSYSKLDISGTFTNLSFGIGYKFANKYSVELKYQETRNVLDYLTSSSEYSNPLTLSLGYSIF
ncbi:outer membrane beta-barrel protein [Tenacibaculum sp.]|nr:outer membrane beta-barrel protein [Tenacibaculum sp.]